MYSVQIMFYAHSRPQTPESDWDPLEEHLLRTAHRAREFLPQYPEVAYTAGLWHDLGKYQGEFQEYLKKSADPDSSNELLRGRVKHSVVGAALAAELKDDSVVSHGLAWAIAAHHGKLATHHDLIKEIRSNGAARLHSCRANIPPAILRLPSLSASPLSERDSPSAMMLWIRMLFSALSDADMLVSEAWDQGAERMAEFASVVELRNRFCEAIAENQQRLESEGKQHSSINLMRSRVLQACLQAAQFGPGQYTLTVPTGGGKTLSSMAFALHHACLQRLKRIIVVIPYTSIIEQTADILRLYLGDENIVEHHSNVDLDRDNTQNQRACENWDAPVIVTTSVQFFESLYAARKGRCRKLHNIADSVVVLDEVQSFPVDLLAPIRRVLGMLSKSWNCTIVHCTATQPTPEAGEAIGPKMDPMPKPIIANPAPLFEVVKKRFRIVIEGKLEQPMPLGELAERFKHYPTAMAIVHNRKEAEQLARLVDGCRHLSARMCAAHRKDVLDSIRAELKAKRPCRLVSTQLIEAGVDISFPVVFRALAGLETLAQAAGRCNRELEGQGEFHIFRAPSRPPSNSLRRGLEATLELRNRPGFHLDLNDPSLFPVYFREVLGEPVQTDAKGISTFERAFDFPGVEQNFRMIDDEGQSVLAPYGDWKRLLDQVRYAGPTRQNLRVLQRYFVQLRVHEIDKLLRLGVIEPLYKCAEPRTWAIREGSKIYDNQFGFGWQGMENPEPEDLIV